MKYLHNTLLDWLEEPFRLTVIKRNLAIKDKSAIIRYLDIDCGNHSASITKKYLHNVEYWGVDRSVYNNGTDDFNYMDRFIDADLEKSGSSHFHVGSWIKL